MKIGKEGDNKVLEYARAGFKRFPQRKVPTVPTRLFLGRRGRSPPRACRPAGARGRGDRRLRPQPGHCEVEQRREEFPSRLRRTWTARATARTGSRPRAPPGARSRRRCRARPQRRATLPIAEAGASATRASRRRRASARTSWRAHSGCAGSAGAIASAARRRRGRGGGPNRAARGAGGTKKARRQGRGPRARRRRSGRRIFSGSSRRTTRRTNACACSAGPRAPSTLATWARPRTRGTPRGLRRRRSRRRQSRRCFPAAARPSRSARGPRAAAAAAAAARARRCCPPRARTPARSRPSSACWPRRAALRSASRGTR